MKIENYPPNVVPLDQARPRKGNAGDPQCFSAIMGKALGETSGSGQVSQSAAGQSVGQAGAAELPELWHQIDGLLTSLEDYSASLADPSTTLKQIGPLMDDIQRQTRMISERLGQQQGAGKLQELAHQAVAQAQAEMIRFNRGDYV